MTPYQSMRRWCVFNAVGILGFAVQLAVLNVLVGLGLHYLLSTVLAVEAAVVHNFFWHRRWTWSERERARLSQHTFWRFHLLNGLVSLAGNVLAMSLLVGQAHLPLVVANVVSVGICGLMNFTLSDRLVFFR